MVIIEPVMYDAAGGVRPGGCGAGTASIAW